MSVTCPFEPEDLQSDKEIEKDWRLGVKWT